MWWIEEPPHREYALSLEIILDSPVFFPNIVFAECFTARFCSPFEVFERVPKVNVRTCFKWGE